MTGKCLHSIHRSLMKCVVIDNTDDYVHKHFSLINDMRINSSLVSSACKRSQSMIIIGTEHAVQ